MGVSDGDFSCSETSVKTAVKNSFCSSSTAKLNDVKKEEKGVKQLQQSRVQRAGLAFSIPVSRGLKQARVRMDPTNNTPRLPFKHGDEVSALIFTWRCDIPAAGSAQSI